MKFAGPFFARCIVGALSFLLIAFSMAENRSFDGLGNNQSNPDRGAKNAVFRRVAPADYDDGISAPGVAGRPNARAISNAVCAAGDAGTNSYNLSDFVWQWGQFLDHDITLAVTGTEPEEAFFIEVGPGDPLEGFIPLMRTIFAPDTGTTSPREQVNSVTSFIDASNVYGSDSVRAAALRTFSGGKLKTSAEGLMPMNTSGLPNANDLSLPEHELFLGGDVRSNEQLGLTCMHTVFLREHNRLADVIAAANPAWEDDQIYHRARKIVGAYMQAITYNEFLPALLGEANAPDPSAFVYDPARDPTATNEFASALYRIGHTMVSDQLLVMGNNGQATPQPTLSVLDAFFSPSTLIDAPEKVDWILMGLSMQGQMSADTQLVDALRNQLFGPAGAGGLDLAALNIQRGRDHGLAGYNDTRAAYGLARKNSFADVTSGTDKQAALASLYATPDDIDLWIGGLVEDHMPGSPVGELIGESMRRQFTDMAEGDRFFYLFDPDLADLVGEINDTRLSDIIMRNSCLTNLQADVFYLRDADEMARLGEPGSVTVSVTGSEVHVTLNGAQPRILFGFERSLDGVVWENLTTGETSPDGTLAVVDTGVGSGITDALYRFTRLP